MTRVGTSQSPAYPPAAAGPETAQTQRAPQPRISFEHASASSFERIQTQSSAAVNDAPRRLPPGKPKLLVVGGLGQALSTSVAQFIADGFDVTVIGRKPKPSDLHQKLLFSQPNAHYQSIDALSASGQAALKQAAEHADFVIMGGEPHAENDREVDAGVKGLALFYETMQSAGYNQQVNAERAKQNLWPKRIIRIGSPPAELPHDVVEHGGSKNVSVDELRRRASSDPSWQNPYFQGKVRFVEAAAAAVERGIDVVTAAPTGIVSWYGDYGDREPILQLMKGVGGVKPLLAPSTMTNFVPGDVVARGIMLVGIAGDTGKTYQLAGANEPTASSTNALLAAFGKRTLPVMTFSTQKLDRQIGLLQNESFDRTARDVADFSARAIQNIGMLALFGPFALGKVARDVGAAWVAGARNGYDNTEALALKAMGLEAWQLSILRQMQTRSSTVAELNARVDDPRFARYPSETEIRGQLNAAFVKQAEWLKRRGLVQRT